MPCLPRPYRRAFLRLLVILSVLAVLAALALFLTLRASLPALDGSRTLAGLTASITIERDADGVPTIHARHREDMARTLGFLHAQDRFFQMDLMRRQAAGELSELLGPAALEKDRESRQHGFRRVVTAEVMDPVFAPVKRRDPETEPGSSVQQPLWSILDARPAHLLPPSAVSWEDLLLRAARAVAILAGTAGWGVIEFICPRARPAWPFF